MGLDMYALTLDRQPESPVDFDGKDGSEIHYWCKHPNLHGWMQNLYYEKGGRDREFNCVNVLLTSSDLDALENTIRSENLPTTCGFFFGETDGSEIEDDLQFVAKAREAIAAGLAVFYTSWW